MEEYVKVSLEDERCGRTVQLDLTNHEVERAQIDSQFLEQLLDKVYEKEALALINSERNDFENRSAFAEEMQDNDNESTTQKSLFIWNDACIFLLLTLYEEHQEEFKYKRHKIVYQKIAMEMKNKSYLVNGSQCQSKLNSLKKMYKKIIDHNNTSGNDRASWPYFDRMNDIFGSTGWANPVSTASERSEEEISRPSEEEPIPKVAKKKKETTQTTQLIEEKKKYYEERLKLKSLHNERIYQQKEKHHKEKMELLKEMLNRRN